MGFLASPRHRNQAPVVLVGARDTHSDRMDEQERSSGLLFPSRDGGFRARSALDKPIRSALKQAGIEKRLTPQALRRTAEEMHRHYARRAAPSDRSRRRGRLSRRRRRFVVVLRLGACPAFNERDALPRVERRVSKVKIPSLAARVVGRCRARQVALYRECRESLNGDRRLSGQRFKKAKRQGHLRCESARARFGRLERSEEWGDSFRDPRRSPARSR
jgi:hypothetical protein